MDLITWVTMA